MRFARLLFCKVSFTPAARFLGSPAAVEPAGCGFFSAVGRGGSGAELAEPHVVTRGIEQPHGFTVRAPGLSIPGFKAGTYYGDDGRSFWDVQGSGEHAIALHLRAGSGYDTIFVDVEDPDEAVRLISSAAAT
jgi:hypothetical protein